MGFFDRFFDRDDTRVDPDSVWQSDAARLAGLRARIERHLQDRQVLVLAHFPETLDTLSRALGISFDTEPASSSDLADALSSPRPGAIRFGLVDQLPREAPVTFGEISTPVSLLVVERHPLRREDERVEQLTASLPGPATVRFHLSLDDRLLEEFAGERLTDMLRQLGMEEEEELTHPLIGKAIARGQEHLAERARGEARAQAASFDDWVRSIDPE